MLAAIGVAIAQKREEAKTHRQSSGIETVWRECEEAYIGIDDANRHEFQDAKWAKPMSVDGPVTTGRLPKGTEHKATAFVRLTSRYVDAGSAKLAEILLPADDKAFSFSETPVPDLIKAKEDTSQVVHSDLGVPLTRPAQPGETPPPDAAAAPAPPAVAPQPSAPQPPAAAPQMPLTVRDLALENIELARKKAKAAETRIYDWMVESQYQAEMRKVICDAAKIGVGVLKAPFPKSKRAMAVVKSGDGVEVIIKERICPGFARVDPWNIFPDAACGENIHDGDHIFERDYMSARLVRKLRNLPGYIGSAIDQVLEEGPDKANIDSDGRATNRDASKHKGRYSVWYYYGSLKREEIDAISAAAGKPPSDGAATDDVYAIVTMINDTVVKATINPLDSGEFPYHSVPWQRRDGHWAGMGVAEQMKAPQRITNASLRAMLNNAGKSAGSQIVLEQDAIVPADGSWAIVPDKIWLKKTGSAGNDVRQAFQMFEIPNVTDQMMKIIELGERLAEESTSIPLITQGQSGATTPDTFGAAQLQNNNANQLLRGIGYSFDDYITEPVVRQTYEWLLLDPDVPDAEKGEFTINAHGSIALVERAIQDQTIAQMGGLVTNPAFGINPKKWAKLFLKSKRLDPEDVQYTEEEQAKIDAAPPPEAPVVTAAKISADTQIKLGVMKQTTEQQSAQSEAQIAAAAHALEVGQAQTEQQRVHGEMVMKAHQIDMEHQRALLLYANQQKISLDQAKAELAKTAMQLQTERALNAENTAASDRKHRREMQQQRPPVQAPGRAANGHQFDQSGAAT